MSGPEVSILTTTLNASSFLGLIRANGFFRKENIERIIVDGGSTDGTMEGLVNLKATQRILRLGASQAEGINFARKLATGQVLGWLNADETYIPDSLEYLISLIPPCEKKIIYGDTIFVDGNGKFIRLLTPPRFSSFVLRSRGCFISTCSFLTNKNTWTETIKLESRFRRMLDWDFFLQLHSEGVSFTQVSLPVGIFTLHSAQITHSSVPRSTAEHISIRMKHGLPKNCVYRFLGDIYFKILKLTSGSYRRQLRAKRLRGARVVLDNGEVSQEFIMNLSLVYGSKSHIFESAD